MTEKRAFPYVAEAHDFGMTLTDYFAAKAMQALICRDGETARTFSSLARTAYLIADNMMIERDD